MWIPLYIIDEMSNSFHVNFFSNNNYFSQSIESVIFDLDFQSRHFLVILRSMRSATRWLSYKLVCGTQTPRSKVSSATSWNWRKTLRLRRTRCSLMKWNVWVWGRASISKTSELAIRVIFFWRRDECRYFGGESFQT